MNKKYSLDEIKRFNLSFLGFLKLEIHFVFY